MANLQVDIVRTEERFQALQQQWDKLLQESSANTVFLTWDWLWTWWQVYGHDYQLFVIRVLSRGKLIALAPLCRRNDRWGKVVPLRRLQFLGANEVCSDYLDFIVAKGWEEDAVEKIISVLLANFREWDFIDLSDIPATSAIFPILTQKLSATKWRWKLQDWTICPFSPLPESWEEYLATLSSNSRRTVRHKINRLNRNFQVTFTTDSIDGQLPERFEHLVLLHQDRWQRQGLSGSFADEKFCHFHRLILERFAKRHRLCLFELSIDKNPAAVFYGFRYANKLYYYQSGLNLDWQRWSVGTILMAFTIRQAIETGCHEFDFLRGNSEYKFHWTKQYRRNLRLVIAQRTPKNMLCWNIGEKATQAKTATKTRVPQHLWIKARRMVHNRY